MSTRTIPQTAFQTDEAPFSALERLEKISVTANLPLVYQNNFKSVSRPVKEDIATIEDVFLNAPSARESALQLIATMCHECIHMSFLKQEQRVKDAGLPILETELCKFFDRLPSFLTRIGSKSLRFDIVKWIFSLCSDITKYNQKRTHTTRAGELIKSLLNIKCINSLVNLLSQVLSALLPDDIKEIVDIVIESFKYGPSFDWIFLHVVTSFSFNFIPCLFEVCVAETKKRYEACIKFQEPKKSQLLVVIFDLMMFLSIEKSPKLRATLFEQISGFFDSNKDPNPLLTAATLLLMFPEITSLIADDIHPLIDTRNLMLLLHQMFKPQWNATQIHPGSLKSINVSLATLKIIKITPLDTLILLYNNLISLVCNPRQLKEQLRLDDQVFPVALQKIEAFMDDVFTTILIKTLSGNDVAFSSLPYLEELMTNDTKRHTMLRAVLCGGNRGLYTSKLLTVACLIDKKKFATNIVSQLLYEAKSEDELKNLIALVRILKSHFVHILSDSLTSLVEQLEILDEKFRLENPTVSVNLNFMRNLASIASWQTNDLLDEGLEIAYGLNFSAIDGHMQIALLDFLAVTLERFALNEHSSNLDITGVVCEWINYMEHLGLIDIHRFNADTLTSLVWKMATIGVLLVRYLPEMTKDEEQVIGVCKKYFDLCKTFICNNQLNAESPNLGTLRWCLTNFIKAFLQNVFDMSHDLFGTKPGMLEALEQMAFDDVPQRFLPKIACSAYMPDKEQDCLEALRSKPFAQRNIASLAHSGTISNQHSKFRPKKWTSVENLRCTLVVGFCSNFGPELNGTIPNFDHQKWCSIGKLLVDLICPDALTSTISWLDWSIEKECVSLYTEVTNKIRGLPLIYDLMLEIGQNGFTSMCSVLPLLKSMFAVLVHFHAVTPRKLDTLGTPQLEDLARVFALLLSSGMLPLKYKALFEVFKVTTHHETYTILAALWEYIRLIVPNNIDELQALRNLEIPPSDYTNKANHRILTTAIAPIVQLHIEKLGRLMSILLTEDESIEEDLW